ncbi:MAG: glycosyltransferase family 2 protein [Planctomycetota bacterium]
MVVPTRNEEASIAAVVREIIGAFDPTRFETPTVLVVDDSTDGTRRVAREAGAEVLIGGGSGLGVAMYEGLKAAAARRPDFIVAVDGDGQADPDEIPRFLQPLIDDEADLVLGSRFSKDDLVGYHYKSINRFGTVVLSWILRRFTGLNLTDSHGGLRAMRCPVAEELEILGTHTYVQETIIDASEKGFRITEIPSVWRERKHGKSRVVGSIPKYVFYTLPILLLRSGQHIRLLYSGGIVLVTFALLYFMTILWSVRFDVKALSDRTNALVAITLLVSLGFNFFFSGLVLQLLKQMKYRLDRTLQRVSQHKREYERESVGS